MCNSCHSLLKLIFAANLQPVIESDSTFKNISFKRNCVAKSIETSLGVVEKQAQKPTGYQPRTCTISFFFTILYYTILLYFSEDYASRMQCINRVIYTVIVVMWEVQIVKRAPGVCFVGMDKIEMKNQQIQTQIVKTVEQHVQAGSTAR